MAAATADLGDAEFGQDDADLCRSLLEEVPDSGLPPEQMRDLRNAISQATARLLSVWGGYMTLEDLDAVAETLRDFGTLPSDAAVAFQAALKEFIDHIDETLGDIDNPDELDDFERDLKSLMSRYGYADDRAGRDIEYRRQAIYEGRVRRSRSHYGGLDHSEPEPDVSDEEIRSMFRGLAH
ncbi:hypothetical protein [Bradyrhizobium sp.]|uniref:hypothetical protein n=1 Tax=Bradyrhizobium sp. TaxID=376 RepID=UPI003C295006